MTLLRTFANLWTLWDHPAAGPDEWSLEQKVSAIKSAGFDGVMGDPGAGVGALAREHGLKFIACRRLDDSDDMPALLAQCRSEGAMALQVHLGTHDTSAEEALALAMRLYAAAQEVGLEVVVETHRNSCIETLEKTDALGEDFRVATGKALPLVFDFSHLAVVMDVQPPFARTLLTDRWAVFSARWHHLRPFNGQHAQIPVLAPDGSLAPEMADWLNFVAELLRLLQAGPREELWVCPEIGPLRGGYNLAAYAASWRQAVALRHLLLELWAANPAARTY